MTAARRITALAAIGVILCWLASCAPSTRQTTISATLTALDTGRVAYVTYDGAHQKDLVDKASSREAAMQALVDYRQTQSKVEAAFAVGYRAVAVAQQLQDDQSFQSMLAAALIVADELKQLGVLK